MGEDPLDEDELPFVYEGQGPQRGVQASAR